MDASKLYNIISMGYQTAQHPNFTEGGKPWIFLEHFKTPILFISHIVLIKSKLDLHSGSRYFN